MDGYKLFRRDRRGRRRGGVALYVRESFDCTEVHDSDDKVECLWVRMRGKDNKVDIMLGVCYRPPNEVEETDESFYKQLAVVSESCALVLVGDFNFQTSAGNTIRQRVSSLGGSWSVWKINS